MIRVAFVLTITYLTFVLPVKGQDSQQDAPSAKYLSPDPNIAPIYSNEEIDLKPRYVRVKEGNGKLPDSAGQTWREYDIRPFTSKMRSETKPEQVIVDWILRETGTDAWISEPSGFISANRSQIRVYHTPEIQAKITRIVDRFVSGKNDNPSLRIRLITLRKADWRKAAWQILTPIQTQSAGIEAWLLQREDAALLQAHLRSRPDFREHNSPHLLISSGHSHTIERFLPRQFVSGIGIDQRTGRYQRQQQSIQEGYSLRINPLFSINKKNIEAAIKCQVEQIEKMNIVSLQVPSGTSTQQVRIEVPQISSWRIHERFRWPSDNVLLISRGLVAMPGTKPATLPGLDKVPVFDRVAQMGPSRVEALLFLEPNLESEGGHSDFRKDFRTGQLNFRGRY